MKKIFDFNILNPSIYCFFAMSCLFLFVKTESRGLSAVLGAMIWILLVLGVIFYIAAYRKIIPWIQKNSINIKKKKQIGLIVFFSNVKATIFDCLCIMSFAVFILLTAIDSTLYACVLFLFTFIFSFIMHCILNGKVFYYIQLREQIKSEMRRKNGNKTTN